MFKKNTIDKLYMGIRLAYLRLRLTYSKGQGHEVMKVVAYKVKITIAIK